MGETFRIAVDRDGGETVVLCAGEIDESNLAELYDGLGSALASDPSTLRIDMTNVTFIDSGVIRAVYFTAKRCDQLNIELELEESPEVERTLRILGIGQLLRDRSRRIRSF